MSILGVPYDDDRIPVPKLRFVHAHEGWVATYVFAGQDIELRFTTNDGLLYADQIQLAELVLPKLTELLKACDDEFKAFLQPGPDASPVAPRLRSLRFVKLIGFRDQGCNLEMGLTSAGDDDVEWIVKFRPHTFPSKTFSAYFVGRRQKRPVRRLAPQVHAGSSDTAPGSSGGSRGGQEGLSAARGPASLDLPRSPGRYDVAWNEAEKVPVPRLTFVDESAGWAGNYSFNDYTLGLRFAGNRVRPYAVLTRLAELVLPRLADLEAACDRYIRAFFQSDDDFHEGSWHLRYLRLLIPPGARGHGADFELGLTIRGDDYGEWLVRFRLSKPPWRVFSPYFAGRQQW